MASFAEVLRVISSDVLERYSLLLAENRAASRVNKEWRALLVDEIPKFKVMAYLEVFGAAGLRVPAILQHVNNRFKYKVFIYLFLIVEISLTL